MVYTIHGHDNVICKRIILSFRAPLTLAANELIITQNKLANSRILSSFIKKVSAIHFLHYLQARDLSPYRVCVCIYRISRYTLS